MKKRVRGRCVIVSNQTFTGPLEPDKKGVLRVILPVRQGTEKDVNDLENLFQQLHFEVVRHREKKAQVSMAGGSDTLNIFSVDKHAVSSKQYVNKNACICTHVSQFLGL